MIFYHHIIKIYMKKQMKEVIEEIYRANNIHGVLTNEHEGMGVLQKEVYELWDAIRSNNLDDVYHEATQVAAMAIKLMMYLDSNDEHECLCDDQDIIEEGFAKLERLNKRKEYGDAFDDMFGFPRI